MITFIEKKVKKITLKISKKQKKETRGSSFFYLGATEGIRTPDRSVRSRVLYPAELQLH